MYETPSNQECKFQSYLRSLFDRRHKGKVGSRFWSRLEGARANKEIRVLVNSSGEFWSAVAKVNECGFFVTEQTSLA